jgi:hypothetical protein
MIDNITTILPVILIILCLGVGALLWRSFFPSYMMEKGKNLATKEDIAEITKQVEGIKDTYSRSLKDLEHQNALVLEQLRAQQQLRLVAPEKRLAAHQEAFTLWRKLNAELFSPNTHAIALECEDWWCKNCLYLSADARDSFNRAYHAAHLHQDLVKERVNAERIVDNRKLIEKAGDDLVIGVQLPSLGNRETEIVGSSLEQSGSTQ